MIVKRGNKFVVTNKAGTKVLGTHPTREAAAKQLAAIEISKAKHMSENKRFKEFRTQLNENEYSEVLTGYPNRSVAPCGAIKFDADLMNRANAMLNAISRSTFMHPNEAFIKIKTRLNLMMLDFPWTPYLWSDAGTGNVTVTVTRYGRVDGVDALTGAIRTDGKANSPDGFMEFILSVGIDIGEDGLYRVSPQLSRKEDVVVEEGVEAKGQELTEGGVKGALEDYMYSLPKSAIPELKEVMKMKPGTAKMGKITRVLRKHGFTERFMGSTPSNVVNDYFDTFYGDVKESYMPKKSTILTQKVVKGKKVGSPRPIAKYDPKAEAARKAKEMKEEAEQIDEAGIRRLKRLMGASYKAYIKRDDKKHSKMAKLAGDLTNKIERAHARRGGASPEVAQQDTPVDKEKGKVTRASSDRYKKRTAVIRKFRNKGTAKKVAAMSEELVGKQHKLDVNKNKRLDSQDFALLRAKKKAVKEEVAGIDEGKTAKIGRIQNKIGRNLSNIRSGYSTATPEKDANIERLRKIKGGLEAKQEKKNQGRAERQFPKSEPKIAKMDWEQRARVKGGSARARAVQSAARMNKENVNLEFTTGIPLMSPDPSVMPKAPEPKPRKSKPKPKI